MKQRSGFTKQPICVIKKSPLGSWSILNGISIGPEEFNDRFDLLVCVFRDTRLFNADIVSKSVSTIFLQNQ